MARTGTTPTTDQETRVTELHTRALDCICICQMEMLKAAPDFDCAYDFADKALRSIGTMRITTIGGRA